METFAFLESEAILIVAHNGQELRFVGRQCETEDGHPSSSMPMSSDQIVTLRVSMSHFVRVMAAIQGEIGPARPMVDVALAKQLSSSHLPGPDEYLIC